MSRMTRTAGRLFLSALLAALAAGARAQVYSGGTVIEALPLGARNAVTNLHAEGGRLFAGPRLVIIEADGTARFVDHDAFTPPAAPDASMFSIDVEGDTIWVGLGFVDEDAEGAPQTAAGFAFSTDGGETWAFRAPQLDRPEDTTVQYGISTLEALPIIVPQQSPPFDLDYDPATGDLWVAGWASGIRRSTDDGASWERIVLPPDTLFELDPQTPYSFRYAPERAPGEEGNNFLGFSVLVDEAGTIWAGTVSGVNRSDSSDVDPGTGDRAWRRFAWDGTETGLVGNWTISIEEQPRAGQRNPVWMANWRALEPAEEFGLTVWTGDDDEGNPIFEPILFGEKIYDVAFDGETVYAGGDNGLFLCENCLADRTWRALRSFRAPDGTVLPVRPGTPVYSVAVTDAGTDDAVVWAGTGDGLLRSTDGGARWALFRTSVPTNPSQPTDEVPEVEAYAYPNPFSPAADAFVRIRFDLESAAAVRVRVFDFGMRLVRELDGGSAPAGPVEVTWDGRTDEGTRVANGVYFYVVDAGGQEATGKILVLE